MPIATAVKAVLDATMAPEQALHLLLSREPGQERV
jgi:glycerol-3-phosphate dehydrogenase